MSIYTNLKKTPKISDQLSNIRYSWLLVIPITVLGFTFLIPLLSIIYSSFFGPVYQSASFGLGGYELLFTDFFDTLLRTVKFAVITTILTIVIALPLAFFIRDAKPTWTKVAILILIIPLMINIIIRNYGWIILLSENGVVNSALMNAGIIDSHLQLVRNDIGVYIGLVHVFLPFAALPIYDVLSSLDSSIQEAARVHGAPRWKTFVYVTLPNIQPGIIAGATIVFVLSLGIYVTPVIMSGNTVITLPMTIRRFTTAVLDWRLVSASATVLLIIAATTVMMISKYTGATAWEDNL